MSTATAPLAERIWSRIDVRRPDECWEWQGTRIKLRGGYGVFSTGGKLIRVHRWMLQQKVGPLPRHILACHSCDNPPCCNPAHLFAGTHSDNARDMFAKGLGRSARGTQHGHAKLTPEIVRALRATYTGGYGELKALVDHYGVSKSTMERALSGRNWKWL